MKHFICQPDTHNGFVALTNDILSYFLVDCPHYQELHRKTAGRVRNAERRRHKDDVSNRPLYNPQAVERRTSPKPNPHQAAEHSTEAIVKVQGVLKLPDCLHSPNSCFGVANESICGSKLVVIGTSTGLLALVHAAEPNCVVFAAGRDPAILRRQGPITRLHPLTPPPPPSTTVGTSAGIASPQVVSRAREMGPEVPTTITWMRSGPMVMVGYSRGQVEWYRVTIAQAKLMELRRHSPSQAEYHNAYVAIPASAFVHHINNPRIAKVTALFSHGEGDGFAMQRVGGCRLPDSGSLMSSDYFPACGHVVVGGERGIFVLSASHLDGPLCRLANCPGTFIYCHPMLPMVGVVAHGPGGDVGGSHAEASPVITEAFDFPATPPSSHIGHAPPSLVLLEYREAAPRKVDVIPSPVMESLAAPMTLGESFVVQPRWRAESSLRVLLRTALRDCAPSRHPSSLSFSWKFSTCAEMVIGNMQEGVLEVIRFGRPTSEQSRRAAGDGGEVGTSSILVTEGQPSGSLTVTHTHALRIPFGSVIDVEYVSAATASLCATNRVDPPPEEPGRTSPHRDQVGPTRRRRSTHHRPSGGSSLPGSFYGGSSDRRRGGGPAAPLKEDRLADELLDHAQGGRRRKERGVGFRPLLITSSPPPSPVAQQPTAMSTTMDEDLRGVMASGPGRFSSVVAFSATGEITTVPVEMEAIAAWHEEGSVFVGLGASVCAADIVSIRGLENIMKTRMVKGFGLSASANVTALLAMEEPPADLIALFGLIDVLEKTAIVGSTGPVPAVMTLLEMPLPPNENLMEMQSVPPPLKHALQFPGLQMDVGRLILLHVLDWLPGSHRDEGSRSYLRPTCTMAEVERAVAVEVLHGRYRHGAALLVEHQHLSHAYFSMASLLQRYEDIFASLHQDGADALENFLESRSLWFFIIFLCVCDRSDTAAAPYAYRSRIYACRQLPLWDRVAIAIILESTTEDLLSVLNEYLVDECDRIQTLILLHGISQDTFPYMQQIVDETGDFQLGACLFARIGVLLSSTSRTDATPAVVAATPVTSDGWPLGGAASALAATGSPSTTSSPSGRAVSGFATTDVTTPSPQLKRTLAFVHRNDIPATSLPGHNPTDAPPCANEWLVASGLSNNFIVSNSILAGSQLPPAAAHLDALEERRSPRRGHGETLCHDYAVLGPPTAEVPPSASPRSDSPQVADADGDCGTRASTTCVKTEMEWEENPWTWWAAAYRTFLNKEQVFVRRTLFDVACQRLREQGLSRVAITHSPTSGEVVNWRCLSALTEEGIATQSTRTLVAALSAHRFRCSVCTEVVGTQQRSASHSLAWCSACLHGGHAQHLADWFSGHRKCPVEGCSCRCGEGDL